MERRGFLKFALGGGLGIVASPMIWTTLYDVTYWTQNWGWIPRLKRGNSEYIPTVSKVCPGGTPLLVRLVNGTVTQTLGNPANDISEGGLTSLAASEGQLLYTESRVKQPLFRGSDGGYRVISWERAESILKEKAQEAGGSQTFISGDPSSSLNEIFSAFLLANGSQDYYYMPTEEVAATKAWQLMGGEGRIGYDFDNSDYILSINANLMESWGTVARNRKIFKNTHPTDGEATMTLAFAGAMQNNTAVVSDLWLPLAPGYEAMFGLAICRELIKRGKGTYLMGIDEFARLVEPYTSERLEREAGLPKGRFKPLIDGLLAAKSPIVISGSSINSGNGAGAIMAAIAANMLLGRVGEAGNMVDLPTPATLLSRALGYETILGNDVVKFFQNIAEKRSIPPKLIFFYEANPVYAFPKNVQVQKTLKQIPFKVAFASFWNETCAECDLILPAAMGLERFDDVYTPYGSGFENWALAKPLTSPRHLARPVGEVMIALAEELNLDLGVKDVPSLLALRAQSLGVDFKTYVENGMTFQAPVQSYTNLHFASAALSQTIEQKVPSGVHLLPTVVHAIGTATTGIPPYANRVLANYQLKGNLAVAQMNSQTARQFNVVHDEKVTLVTDAGKMPVIVAVYEGIMTGVISIVAGLGHTEFDRFSMNKGGNILDLGHVKSEAFTGLPVWSNGDVKVEKG